MKKLSFQEFLKQAQEAQLACPVIKLVKSQITKRNFVNVAVSRVFAVRTESLISAAHGYAPVQHLLKTRQIMILEVQPLPFDKFLPHRKFK